MKKLFFLSILLLLLTFTKQAHAQAFLLQGQALYNSGGNARIIPSAVITVCSFGASGIPCATPVPVYTTATLTTQGPSIGTPIGIGTFNADINGNYAAWVPSGFQYTYTITGVGINGQTFNVTAGSVVPGIIFVDGVTYPKTDVGLQAAINASVGNSADIFIPDNTTVVLSHGVTIANKNLTLRCGSRFTSLIAGNSGGAAKFVLTGAISHLEVSNCQFTGNSPRTFDLTGVTPAEGRWIFDSDWIENEAQGGGNYWLYAAGNPSLRFFSIIHTWVFGSGGIYLSNNSDITLSDNYFECPQNVASFTTEGGSNHLTDNTFIYGACGTGTQPDVWLRPRTGGSVNFQNLFAVDNKFGSEGEISGRNKVLVLGDSGTYVSTATWHHNFFNGVASQKVFSLQSAIHGWTLDSNTVSNASTFLDDTYTPINTDFGPASEIFGNKYIDPSFLGSPLKLCTNGCRGFSRIEYGPATSDEAYATLFPRDNESTLGLVNRVQNSENFAGSCWSQSPAAHITLTTGQTDPWGSTRATLLTRLGTAGPESLACGFNNTSLTNQLVLTFWAKAGTGNTLEVSLFDNTVSAHLPEKTPITLSSSWKRYKVTWGGIPTADSISLFVYPDGEGQTTGTLSLVGMQISDYDSDYIATSVANATSAAGNSLQRPVLWQAPAISQGTLSVTGTGACATITTTSGGAWAGRGTCTGTTGASTIVITSGITAPNGYSCEASDKTTAANILRQSADNGTTCTIAGTVNANDVISWGIVAAY